MTTLEGAPLEAVLEDVLSDVLNGVVVVKGGLQLEDLTPRHLSLVMIRVQTMRRAKVEDFKDLTVQLAEAEEKATTTEAMAFLAHSGPQEERRHVGKQAAAKAKFEVDSLKGQLKACEKAMDILKDDWDSCRSIGANERAQRNALEGIGG